MFRKVLCFFDIHLDYKFWHGPFLLEDNGELFIEITCPDCRIIKRMKASKVEGNAGFMSDGALKPNKVSHSGSGTMKGKTINKSSMGY